MKEKYGEPKDHGTKFKTKDLRYKCSNFIKSHDDKELTDFLDKSIREGKAWLYTAWESNDTLILLHLHGNKGIIMFEISYASLKLKRLTDEDLL